MAEVLKASDEVNEVVEKQLNDRSYKGAADESGVAGLESNENEQSNSLSDHSVESSGYSSLGKSEWEDFEGEIVNLSTFQLECMQSSNVVRQVGECEISSIAHENGTPHLRKGKIESKTEMR